MYNVQRRTGVRVREKTIRDARRAEIIAAAGKLFKGANVWISA
jgi:hypothetical protein